MHHNLPGMPFAGIFIDSSGSRQQPRKAGERIKKKKINKNSKQDEKQLITQPQGILWKGRHPRRHGRVWEKRVRTSRGVNKVGKFTEQKSLRAPITLSLVTNSETSSAPSEKPVIKSRGSKIISFKGEN